MNPSWTLIIGLALLAHLVLDRRPPEHEPAERYIGVGAIPADTLGWVEQALADTSRTALEEGGSQ